MHGITIMERGQFAAPCDKETFDEKVFTHTHACNATSRPNPRPLSLTSTPMTWRYCYRQKQQHTSLPYTIAITKCQCTGNIALPVERSSRKSAGWLGSKAFKRAVQGWCTISCSTGLINPAARGIRDRCPSGEFGVLPVPYRCSCHDTVMQTIVSMPVACESGSRGFRFQLEGWVS